MRASRAYIAGLGTTSVLVCSALVTLLLGTTVLAFTGWPGSGALDDIGHVVLGGPSADSSTAEGQTARRGHESADGAKERHARRHAMRGDSSVVRARSGSPTLVNAPRSASGAPRAAPAPRSPSGNGDGGASTPSNTVAPSPTAAPVSTPSAPAGKRGLTDGLADTTGGLKDGLGQTVGGLNPQLGRVVTDSGRTLSGLLRGLDGLAEQATRRVRAVAADSAVTAPRTHAR